MYKLIGQNSVKRLSDNAHIPFTDGNRDYEEYKLWLEDGNIPVSEFTEEEIKQQEQANLNQKSLNSLNSTDWKVIRELERLYLKGTDLNIQREALRESIIRDVING